MNLRKRLRRYVLVLWLPHPDKPGHAYPAEVVSVHCTEFGALLARQDAKYESLVTDRPRPYWWLVAKRSKEGGWVLP